MNDLGGNVSGASPGFVNESAQDFHLAAGSACVNAGGPLAASASPLLSEYVKHRQATTVSASRIDLAWIDASGDETGFDVERSADGGSQWAVVGNVGANVVAHQDVDLAAATTYAYRVRATNGNGASAPSSTAVATTEPGNPPLCASDIAIGRATLRLRAAPFSLALKGEAVIPRPWAAVDPVANGLRIRVDGLVGPGGIDAILPAGPGWSVNATGRRWTWRDPAGMHAGITKAKVTDASRARDGLLRWSIRGKGGTVLLPDVSEVRTAVVLGAPAECAALAWGGPAAPRPRCRGDLRALRCR